MLKKLLIALLPLGTIAVVVWLVIPEYRALGEAKAERERASAQLEEKKDFIIKVKRLEAQYREIGDTAKKVAQIIPAEPDVPNLLAEIPTMALQHGMVLKDLTFSVRGDAEARDSSASGEAGSYQSMDASLVVTGTYDGLKIFLRALERELRIMDVLTLQFSIPTGDDQLQLFTFSITLRMYYGLNL